MEILNKNEAGFEGYKDLVVAAVAVENPEEGKAYPLGLFPLLQAAKDGDIQMAPKLGGPKPE